MDAKALFDERLGRYQAAINLEPTDRVPIAPGSNYFAETYSGNNNQETIYDPEKWLEAEKKFCADFPEFDVLRNNNKWGPRFDVMGGTSYRLPGRELDVKNQFQFVEKDYMREDEYDQFIADPKDFMLNVWLPRMATDFVDKSSNRYAIAMFKSGMAHAMFADINKNRSIALARDCGMPQPQMGAFLAPLDALSDAMRGLKGIMRDMRRQPEKVKKACDIMTGFMIYRALGSSDPQRRYPTFVPTHKAMFMAPKEFDEFFWPSFRDVCLACHEHNIKVRAYLEGNWDQHLHRLLELPKASLICDIDAQGSIYKAKEILGGHHCITGGVAPQTLCLGTPEKTRAEVKHLCETVGQGGGWIISAGCNLPYEAKAENVRAMVEAVMEYGWYDKSIKHKAKTPPPAVPYPPADLFTPWAVKKAEMGEIKGDESLIEKPWTQFEKAALSWLLSWLS